MLDTSSQEFGWMCLLLNSDDDDSPEGRGLYGDIIVLIASIEESFLVFVSCMSIQNNVHVYLS
jgi:hypothetical protein